MKEFAVGRSDVCTGLNILSDDTFYFYIFSGVGFTMKCDGNDVVCIRKVFVK